LREGVGNGGCGSAHVRNPEKVIWKFWGEPSRISKFSKSARSNLFFLGKWLTLAFFLESLMLAYIPAENIVALVGGGDFASIALATLAGVPAYLNGYAALPLVAGLMEQGMSSGAGMAFLIGGGVTSIPAAMAVWALARFPVFVAYIFLSLAGAFSAGMLFQAWTIL
ncbi:MAG: permease, partial [Devosiaceae bacterium]|nr:permease [Devosiaceae bacterium]